MQRQAPEIETAASYTRLDSAKIIGTAERLAARIADTFPGSSLSRVAAELVIVARASERGALLLNDAVRPLRILVGTVLGIGIAAAIVVVLNLRLTHVEGDAIPLVQGIESAMNIAVLVGLGVVGLVRLESGWKKRRALAAIHPLRSLAHVIDMHQLTKDPATRIPSSAAAQRQLPPGQLVQYLDYCSELLSLIGKLAALYAQSHQDPVVGSAVNDIELLATNLSRKIWQKIAIASRAAD